MAHAKSHEVSLAIKTTDELLKSLDDLRAAWKHDHSTLPKGLSCSESKEGQFILVAAESAFVTIPRCCSDESDCVRPCSADCSRFPFAHPNKYGWCTSV